MMNYMITGDAVGNKPASFYFNISCVFEKGRLEKAICVRIMGVERQKKCEGGGQRRRRNDSELRRVLRNASSA